MKCISYAQKIISESICKNLINNMNVRKVAEHIQDYNK